MTSLNFEQLGPVVLGCKKKKKNSALSEDMVYIQANLVFNCPQDISGFPVIWLKDIHEKRKEDICSSQ